MQIKITGIKEMNAKLDDIAQKRLAMVTRKAIEDTVFQARIAVQNEMATKFDRPTDWALKSVRVDISQTKSKVIAWIGLDWQMGKTAASWKSPRFAPHEIYGGTRPYSKTERVLRSGGVLPNDMYIAPARDAWTDQHGNISGQELRQIQNSVGALGDRGRLITSAGKIRTRKQNRYFVMKKGGRPIGIAEVLGVGNIRMVLMFIKMPNYKARFRFFDVVKNVVLANYYQNFMARIKEYALYKI
jgi:hypothetical protein